MKQLLFLGLLVSMALGACQITPEYPLDILQGKWRRTASSDPSADSMEIYIQNDSGVITYVPTSTTFTTGMLKWDNITSIAVNANFELLDYSINQQGIKAYLYVDINDDTTLILESQNYPKAPGGQQTWMKIP